MAALKLVGAPTMAKDSSWLQVDVCRDHQKKKCARPDSECKFAHLENGKYATAAPPAPGPGPAQPDQLVPRP